MLIITVIRNLTFYQFESFLSDCVEVLMSLTTVISEFVSDLIPIKTYLKGGSVNQPFL